MQGVGLGKIQMFKNRARNSSRRAGSKDPEQTPQMFESKTNNKQEKHPRRGFWDLLERGRWSMA